MAWGELRGPEGEGPGSGRADVSAISAENAWGWELAAFSPVPPIGLVLARKVALSK
jgi:hypothetical protein